MPNTYIIYSRCSTEEQRKKGNSHEYQIREIEAYANRKGMKAMGVFSDTLSGTSFVDRSQLDTAYEMCKNMRGEVNYLLTYKMDRFGREVGDALAAIKKFRSIGVEVNFTDEWIDYQDPSHPISLSLKLALAQTESLKISDRTKDGIYQNQLNGYWPFNAPVGYTKMILDQQKSNGKHFKLCVPDDKAPIVQKVFELLATGSYSLIQLYRQYGKRLGVSKSYFNDLVKNPFYCGEFHLKAYKSHSSHIVKGKHEPLISRDMFNQCQEVMKKAEGHTTGKTWQVHSFEDANYYLKGILRCDRTDKYMTAFEVTKPSGLKYQYYSTPAGSRKKAVPVEKAHNLIARAVREFSIDKATYTVFREELEAEHSDRSKDVKKSMDEINRVLTREKQRIGKITADYADGLIDAQTFGLLRAGFVSSISEKERELVECQSLETRSMNTKYQIMSLLSDLGKIYDHYGSKQKNLFLKAAFPEGFYIDDSFQEVLTRRTNVIFDLLGWKTDSYEIIKIKPDLQNDENPVRGGKTASVLTDLIKWEPLIQAI